MSQNRNQRPAPRNDRNQRPADPTNTAALPRERVHTRDELNAIAAKSLEFLGLDATFVSEFGSAHRVFALARTALIVAGAKANAAEAAGTPPGTAWASARDFHHLVFNSGNPAENHEERKDRRNQQPRRDDRPTLADAKGGEGLIALSAQLDAQARDAAAA